MVKGAARGGTHGMWILKSNISSTLLNAIASYNKIRFFKNNSLNSCSVDIATEFTLFSKLPAEIRLMIWKEALPLGKDANGRRIISLDYYSERNPWTEVLWDRLKVDKRKKGSFATTRDILDIGMAGACIESRECFLNVFKHVIPLRKGIVRYEQDTIIFIRDRWGIEWLGASTNALLNQHENPLPAWFDSIKRLAFYDFNKRWQLHRFYLIISAFKNLEYLIEVVDVCCNGTNIRISDNSNIANIQERPGVAAVKESLRNYKTILSITDYKIPDIDSIYRFWVEGREAPEDLLLEDLTL